LKHEQYNAPFYSVIQDNDFVEPLFSYLVKIKYIMSEVKNIMDTLIDDTQVPPMVGDLVEGNVIALDKAAVYVDLAPYGTGLIYGREYITARDLVRKLHVGDTVSAKVTEFGGDSGYIELSVKEARQAQVWGEVEDVIKNKTPIEIPVIDANKGGLLMSWQGLQGFLPASQLKPEHYPRVQDGDKERILEELRKLVNEKLVVTIIGATEDDGRLIFSEKNVDGGEAAAIDEKYNVGDVVKGEVTGAVDFGVFVKLKEGLEGLVHISEIDWALVEDPRQHYNTGDKVDVKIIEVKDGKVSLSIKQLKENPWQTAEAKYKKGDVVEAVVIKYNKHGALASIEEGVAGLVHVSEFENEQDLRDKLALGSRYNFKISLFEPKDQKMTLSHEAK